MAGAAEDEEATWEMFSSEQGPVGSCEAVVEGAGLFRELDDGECGRSKAGFLVTNSSASRRIVADCAGLV